MGASMSAILLTIHKKYAAYTVGKQSFTWLLLICAASASLIHFNAIPVGSFFDDAHYIVLAESLSSGRGYHLINYPTAPVETAFPPGWPLLLTPVVKLLPGNFIALKMVAFLFWLASIPLIYRLGTKILDSPYLEAAMLLIVLNPHLAGMSSTVMSESAYLFFSLLTVCLLLAWEQKQGGQRTGLLIAALATAVCTLLIRTIGIALLAALFVYLLVNGRRRNILIVAVLSLLALLPLAWFNQQNGGAIFFSPSYKVHFEYVMVRLVEMSRIWEHIAIVPPEAVANTVLPILDLGGVTTVLSSAGTRFVGLVILLLIFSGYLLSLKKHPLPAFYISFYLVIFYLWSVYIEQVQLRILLPLIPFLAFYMMQAIVQAAKTITRHNQQKTTPIILGIAAFILSANMARHAHNWYSPIRDRVVDLSIGNAWLQQNAPDEAIIMSANPVPDYLYSRRQTAPYPAEGIALNQHIAEIGVDFVLVRPLLQDWHNPDKNLSPYAKEILLPFLNNHPEQFEKVYWQSAHNVSVFKVLTTP